MKQDGRTLYAEGKKVLYIEKLNKYTRQYTCGTVMLPIEGVLQEVTVTPEDVEEVYKVEIDGNTYRVKGNNYEELVTNLIRLKYSLDWELSLIANSRIRDISKDDKDFQDWRAESKKIAKNLINE